jgi:uracil-DNA glycosylase
MQIELIFSDLPQVWHEFLGREELSRIASEFDQKVLSEESYPPRSQRFRAFELCSPAMCSAVIVGQDPYHGPDQATGLAFSVNRQKPIPPSLRNILKEWRDEFGVAELPSGDLTPWARRGVLLMNRVLSVRPGEAGSHRNLGWERFTDLVIKRLAADAFYRVFCLWGSDARQLRRLIDERQGVIESVHPSPLSAHRGFFGSKPFSQINQRLIAQGLSELDWSLPLNLPSYLQRHMGQLF